MARSSIAKPTVPLLPAPLNTLVLSVPFATPDTTPKNLVNGVASAVTGSLSWSRGPFGPCRDIGPLGGSNTEQFTLSSGINWLSGPWTVEAWMTFRQFQGAAPNISGVFWNNDS